MSLIEILLLGVGLSMDAFAVSICKGLAMKRITAGKAAVVGLWFGGFQALMPLIGYLAGSAFSGHIQKIDHWIAFLLLGIIGGNMLKESFHKDDCHCDLEPDFSFMTMLGLAVATSIDALAIGVSLAFLKVNILTAVALIGVTTFCFSAVGVVIGKQFGARYKSKAEFTGGFILVAMGLKILLEHTNVI
jgi:putative Mn2+ efflux pump MntP